APDASTAPASTLVQTVGRFETRPSFSSVTSVGASRDVTCIRASGARALSFLVESELGSGFLSEHDLIRKPVPTFRDHARPIPRACNPSLVMKPWAVKFAIAAPGPLGASEHRRRACIRRSCCWLLV